MLKGEGEYDAVITAEPDDYPMSATVISSSILYENLDEVNYETVYINSPNTTKSTLILYTSGTEGSSKGVCLSQYSFINNAINVTNYMDLTVSDKICFVTALHHCFGIINILMSIIVGSSLFFPSTLNFEYLLKTIQRYELTILNAVPTIFLGLIRSSDFDSQKVKTLKSGIIAGGKCSPRQFIEISQKLEMYLFSSYGMTECCATITFSTKCDSIVDRAETVGKFIDGVSGCIQGNNNNILPKNQIGEICVKGYNLMQKYEGVADSVPFTDSEGWFHTGDIGYIDNQERLHITDRLKDIIIKGGENLSPHKISNIALQFEEISECVVIGIEDDYYGEVPIMIINTSEGFILEKFRSFLKNNLEKSEIPSKIVEMSYIPQNENGKYDKSILKKMFGSHI